MTEAEIEALQPVTGADLDRAKWSLVKWMFAAFGAGFGLAGLIIALG